MYAASILTLLKPWRHPDDIKRPGQSWKDALNDFLSTAEGRLLDIMDNIEHRHDAQATAESKQSASNMFDEIDTQGDENIEIEDYEPDNGPYRMSSLEITQEMIDKAQYEMEDRRDVIYRAQAIQIGQSKGLFNASQQPTQSSHNRATDADMNALKNWLYLLEWELSVAHTAQTHTDQIPNSTVDIGDVELIIPQESIVDSPRGNVDLVPMHEKLIDPVQPASLFREQQRAYGMVQWHLMRTVSAQDYDPSLRVPQLLMLLTGEGGTGKSKVIQTITEEFKRLRIAHKLIKAAFTGMRSIH
ncbi:hypothetical protein FS749_006618 [Ceratobasidium sp. UAMH 11750]|nr:hypothetical protein FS749_006618 [Ceratobasidium sp. UAMH 11750]